MDKFTEKEPLNIVKPYFMENSEWFYIDNSDRKMYLTEKAPKKAVESYKEFFSLLQNQ